MAYLALAGGLQPLLHAGLGFVAIAGTLLLDEVVGARSWRFGGAPWLQAAFALVVGDFGKYWIHRLAHERPWLWRFHAAHHSPSRMYALNGTRLHPVNLAWSVGLDLGVPLALGLDGTAVVLAGVLRTVATLLQHANLEMRLVGLNWVFSTPDLHQWHHSGALAEGNTNYGATLIVWDALFRTRFLPKGRGAPERLGLAPGATHPKAFLEQLWWPLCGERLAACPSGRLACTLHRLFSP